MQFVLLSSAEIQAELCSRIKKLRLSKNISQEEFALMVGVSARTIRNLEKDGGCTLNIFINCLMALGAVSDLESLLTVEVASIAQMEKASQPTRQRASKTNRT